MDMSNANYQNCKLKRAEIDAILQEMAAVFTNLGTDSTLEEVQWAYNRENELIDKIALIDPDKAQSIRPYGNQ
jgi:hypothetical protein